MGASLTVLVGIPIIVGKVFLTLDLVRSLVYTSHLILRGARTVTDPVVDILVEIAKDVVVLPTISSLRTVESIAAGQLGLDGWSHSAGFGLLSRLLASNEPAGTQLADFLALIGSKSFDTYQAYRTVCAQIAASDRMSDRVWCMCTGYAIGAPFIVIYAIAGQAGHGRVSAAVAAQVKQHTTFLKLAFFMALELALFPLGIGLIIDACTIPLFSKASLMGRFRQLRGAPFGVLFVSWLVGTL